MHVCVLAFLIGDLWLQHFSKLPTMIFVGAILVINLVIFLTLRKRFFYLCIPMAFISGFVWSAWYANSILLWSLPEEFTGKPVLATGYVASLPTRDVQQQNFIFSLEKLHSNNMTIKHFHADVRLAWRDDQEKIKVGDKRQFLVRLKPIRGTQNPGGFDYEAWAMQKGLRATGYVVKSPENTLLAHHGYTYPIAQFRQLLQERIQSHLPHSPTSPWLQA